VNAPPMGIFFQNKPVDSQRSSKGGGRGGKGKKKVSENVCNSLEKGGRGGGIPAHSPVA